MEQNLAQAVFVPLVFVCVLCPDRDSGDFFCVLLFVVLTAAVSSNFLQSVGADDRSKGDGWQTQKKRGWMAGQVRMKDPRARAVSTDGRKEWCCRSCSETNVWPRSKGRRCQTNIPFVLKGELQAGCFDQGGSVWFSLVSIRRL